MSCGSYASVFFTLKGKKIKRSEKKCMECDYFSFCRIVGGRGGGGREIWSVGNICCCCCFDLFLYLVLLTCLFMQKRMCNSGSYWYWYIHYTLAAPLKWIFHFILWSVPIFSFHFSILSKMLSVGLILGLQVSRYSPASSLVTLV